MSDIPKVGSVPTITELEILHQIITNNGTFLQAAKTRYITPNTLKSHLYRLYTRLDVPSVHRATAECFRLGYLFIENDEIKHIYMKAGRYAA